MFAYLAVAALLWSGSKLGAQENVAPDRAALMALYSSTAGAGWKSNANWSTSEPLSEWFGVSVDFDGRITRLELKDNGLKGGIPSELGNLVGLRRLDLQGNELSGSIPGELGRLPSLDWLDLSDNALGGSIPSELGGLANLRVLDLSANSLSGAIPSELGDLERLTYLNLTENVLSGEIPNELANLRRLGGLYLLGNRLTGSVPSELGSLEELERLWLADNDLGGTLPVSLAHLTKLEQLLAYGNEVCAPRLPGFQFWLANVSFQGVNCPPDDRSIVDVAVFYNQAARAELGGWRVGVRAEIDLMIAETNRAYAIGGVNLRLSLAATEEVTYRGTNSATDLGRLQNPADGYLDDVHELRDAVGADIVVLMVGDTSWTDADAVCGRANQLSDGWLSKSFATEAFFTMQARCGGSTLAHEIGHVLGLRHDRYEACEEGVCRSGAFSYGHGYVNQRAFERGASAAARWRTVMAYDNQCEDAGFECAELLRFSSPLQSYRGDPMGVPGSSRSSDLNGPSDAVRTLNLTRETVSNLRQRAVVGPPVTLSFGAESYTSTEGGSAASVTVRLSSPAQGDLSIPLAVTVEGGASIEDYSGVPLRLHFATGESAAAFDVVASDDTADDEGEQLVLGFGALPQGATAIEPSRVAVRLVDNDLSTQTVALASGGEILLSRDGTGPWMLDGERAENGSEVARNDETHVLELVDGQWRLARYAIRSVVGETAVEDGIAATKSVLFAPNSAVADNAGNVYVADTKHHRIRMVDASGMISTLAGTGDWGFSGDGGPAAAARLANPFGLALDREGNLYVSDSGNHRVRRIDAVTRTIETVAGTGEVGFSFDGGPAIAAEVIYPRGIATDGAGNVLVAEPPTSRVRRIDTVTGTIDTVAGTGSTGHSGDGGPSTEGMLRSPQGVAADLSGNLYVADTWNHRLRRIDHATGVIETLAGGGGPGFSGDGGTASQALLDTPAGVAVDAAGNVFVADTSNTRIRRIDAMSGVIETVAGTGEAGYSGDGEAATAAMLFAPQGVAVDGSGNVYIADTLNHRVRRIDSVTRTISSIAGSGSPTASWAGGEAGQARLDAPVSLALDGSGSVLFVDSNRLWKLDASGMTKKLAGTGSVGDSGDGGPASEAMFNRPQGIVADKAGNVYIADTSNHRIRWIDVVTGLIATLAGTGESGNSGDGGPASDARLSWPHDVALDPAGNVLVADTRNHRIRRIDVLTGVIETVGAAGGGGSLENGGLASVPALHGPTQVAVDGEGNIYVAERWNRRVVRVDPLTGAVETILSVEGPEALAVDSAGDLLVGAGHRVLSIGPEGETVLIAGTGRGGFSGDGKPAAGAELSVSGIAVDAGGTIWFSDPTSRRIRVLEPLESRN
ncbi:MAG: M12 family metallo-peptidase [Bryobacterales bacterium]|nr:M12 family metallo-peptidase [Bryobacterales bacterium]